MATMITVAGPTEIHVGVNAGGAYAFLGWSDPAGVRIQLQPLWRDVRVDLAGDMPFDVIRKGEIAVGTCRLAAWDPNVMRACQSRGNPAGGVAGVMNPGEIGGMMAAEGAAYPVLFYPPFMSKPTQAGQLPWRFPRGFLAGPDDIGPLATEQEFIHVIFRAIPVYDPLTGKFTLYDSSAAGKPPAA